jgi:hypothetical protein
MGEGRGSREEVNAFRLRSEEGKSFMNRLTIVVLCS